MTKNPKQQPLYFQIVLIAGFIFIAFMLFALARSIYRDLFQVGRYIEVSQNFLEKQKEQINKEPEELAYANSPRFREKIAKELLGLGLPGEKLIIISSENQDFEDLLLKSDKEGGDEKLLTNPQKWRRYIFGW